MTDPQGQAATVPPDCDCVDTRRGRYPDGQWHCVECGADTPPPSGAAAGQDALRDVAKRLLDLLAVTSVNNRGPEWAQLERDAQAALTRTPSPSEGVREALKLAAEYVPHRDCLPCPGNCDRCIVDAALASSTVEETGKES